MNNLMITQTCGKKAIDYNGANNTSTTSAVPVMTSNTAPSGIVSGTNDEGLDNMWYAFNGNITTVQFIISTISGGTGWTPKELKYEFPTALIINKAMLYQGNWFCTDYVIQGSNNNIGWATLKTNASASAVELNTETWTNSTAYKWYKIVFNNTTDSDMSNTYLGIKEFKLIEAN